MKKYHYLALLFGLCGTLTQANEVEIYQRQQKQYVVFSPLDLKSLVLALNNSKGKPIHYFSTWQKQLKSCEKIQFAMNAGMYQPDYQAVGLYIENSKQINELNQDNGFGNFFIKPNGILAWNQQQAVIVKAEDWQKVKFDSLYATQSGPMLVIDGKIHPQFIRDSDSKKIRNGVGIKDGKLYFVMSQQRVNFYEFAEFFQQDLGVQQALYLDGSISSIYAPAIKRHDRAYKLGPMLGYIQSQC